MAARKLSSLYATRLTAIYAGLEALDAGGASATVLGVTYGSSDADRAKLEALAELTSVKSTIALIEEGGQAMSHGDGRALTQANLPDLYKRRDELTRRAAATTRGGIPVTLGVPLG